MKKQKVKAQLFYSPAEDEYIVQEEAGGGGFTSYPLAREPSLKKHVDGPLLSCRDGTLHWLTWSERLQLWLGLISLETLDAKHCRVDYTRVLGALLYNQLSQQKAA